MNQKRSGIKKILACCLLIGCLTAVSSCGRPGSGSGSAQSSGAGRAPVSSGTAYEVTDSRGQSVKFSSVPEKVISLLPSDTEIVYALGGGGKLIAVDSYSDYPPEAKKKPQLAGGNQINVESILGLKPDLVIAGEMEQAKDQYKQLEDAGVKVLVTRADNLAETYQVIDMIGKALNRNSEAGKIVSGMKSSLASVGEQAKSRPPKSVYLEISPLSYKLWSCGKNTFQDELLTLIGAKNIFSDLDGWKEVSEEQVISRNPDVILTTFAPTAEIPDPVKEIETRKNWQKIAAVKNGRVYRVDSEAIERPGPRLADAAKDLFQIIYG